jgi:hypothetical protein
MKQLMVVVVVVICLACARGIEAANSTFSHHQWQLVLDQYLHANTSIDSIEYSSTFDYQGLRRDIALANTSPFTTYLQQLADITSLDDYSIDEQFAILINGYNALAVNMVIQHPCKTSFGKVPNDTRSLQHADSVALVGERY